MKKLFIYLNAFFFLFQQAAWGLSKDRLEHVKSFVEATEISKREVPLREFFLKIANDLPPATRAEFQRVVDANPNAVLPRFTVNKVKGADGSEDVQLQFVADKKSVLMSLKGDGDQVAQIGNIKFTSADFQNLGALSEKVQAAVPMPTDKIKTYYKATQYGLLSYDQFKVLPAQEKKAYVRKMRELAVSMEKVDQSKLKLRSPAKTTSEFKYLRLLMDEAHADFSTSAYNADVIKRGIIDKSNFTSTECMYAGHIANYGYKVEGSTYSASRDKKDGHYACGGPESPFFNENLSSSSKAQSCTTSSSKPGIKCNKELFGEAPGSKLCAALNDVNATQYCAANSNAIDALYNLDKFNNAEEFDKGKQKLLDALNQQKQFCEGVRESTARSPDKGDKSKPHLLDQKTTCDALLTRINEIEQLRCDLKDGLLKDTTAGATKDQYVKGKATGAQFSGSSCEAKPATDPGAGDPKVKPVQCKEGEWFPGPVNEKECKDSGGEINKCPGGEGKWRCDCAAPKTPVGFPATKCAGPVTPPAPPEPPVTCSDRDYLSTEANPPRFCTDTGGFAQYCPTDKTKWKCSCPNGVEAADHGVAYQCKTKSSTGGGDDKRSDTKSSWKMPSWLPMLAIGAVGVGLFYWATKSSMKSSYNLLTPSPTATPVPATSATPRTRGAY